MKAANGEVHEEILQALKSSVYSSDINFEQLHRQLPILVSLIRQALPSIVSNIHSYYL